MLLKSCGICLKGFLWRNEKLIENKKEEMLINNNRGVAYHSV
jgi:hypothetical protein